VLACRECEAAQRPPWGRPPGSAWRCCRCGALLYRAPTRGLEQTLALALAALALAVIGNAIPVVVVELQGRERSTTLLGVTRVLWDQDRPILAVLVLITAVVLPLLQAAGMAAVLATAWRRKLPLAGGRAARWLGVLRVWAQSDIVLLGVLVALAKLGTLAEVRPGLGLFALAGAMILSVVVGGSFSGAPLPDDRAGPAKRGQVPASARGASKLQAPLAFLLAAIILYVPANVLPIMRTTALFRTQEDTIIGGIVFLWDTGSWPLAVVVFVASVAVPLVKFLALGLLIVTSWRRSSWRRGDRARLYRGIELVGRWSMLDIYVVGVLAALVRARPFAAVEAGPAALAFAAVVVLTMLASASFDPRSIWAAGGPG
jgi:paraquat-inducible protein A